MLSLYIANLESFIEREQMHFIVLLSFPLERYTKVSANFSCLLIAFIFCRSTQTNINLQVLFILIGIVNNACKHSLGHIFKLAYNTHKVNLVLLIISQPIKVDFI